MLESSTLKWFSHSQLDRLSTTYKFANVDRWLTFSFDPEKARLFEPPRKCITFEKPLTGVQLTLQNCICSIVVKGLLRWRKPLIDLLHWQKNEVNYTFEMGTCNNTQLFVHDHIKFDLNIWVHTYQSHIILRWIWCCLTPYLDWWYLLKYKWNQ